MVKAMREEREPARTENYIIPNGVSIGHVHARVHIYMSTQAVFSGKHSKHREANQKKHITKCLVLLLLLLMPSAHTVRQRSYNQMPYTH